MNIAFDAKRAFHNQTGLGHYSRTLIQSLSVDFPQHEYFLFNPKPASFYHFPQQNIHEVLPEKFLHKKLSAFWRYSWLKEQLKELDIDLYHGLSQEIPHQIDKLKIKSVVTLHDLIHERYPGQYSFIDRKIYTAKYTYACKTANHVIAISQQTKRDLIEFYKVPAEKITVCYQSCNPAFMQQANTEEKKIVKERYGLPDRFYLSVGSVIERKNLLTICKAIKKLDNTIPLVVIGTGGAYLKFVKKYIAENNIESRIIFLNQHHNAKQISFTSSKDLPSIYQLATALIYPSSFEGFGIPVLEAMFSGIPVITSNVSCLPETGGDAALYIDPLNENALAEVMERVTNLKDLRKDMIEKGFLHAQNFTPEKCAAAVMEVYKKI